MHASVTRCHLGWEAADETEWGSIWRVGDWVSRSYVLFALLGCSGGGSIRGAASVVGAVKSCPEVTNLDRQAASNWSASFNIDPGDGATLKAGLKRLSEALEQHAASVSDSLKSECSGLANDLRTPITAETGEEACQQASSVLDDAKSKLGTEAKVVSERVPQCTPGCASPCDVASPAGPCARSVVTVHVVGAVDQSAADRYAAALQTYLPAMLATIDAEGDARGLVSNARSAIELGIMTGRAVSDGDIESAAAAAVCILPPLLSAAKHIADLRADLHLLAKIASTAGLAVSLKLPTELPLALHTFVGSGAPPFVPPPLEGQFSELFAFPDGGFAAQTKDGIVELPGGRVLLQTRRPPASNTVEINLSFGGSDEQLRCAVGSGHRAVCLRVQPIFNKSSYAGSRLELLDSAQGERVVVQVGDKSSLFADGIGFDSAGQLLFGYSQVDQVNNQTIQQAHIVRGGQELTLPFFPEHGSLEEIGGGGRGDPPIRFFEYQGRTELLYRSGRTLLLAPLDRPNAAIQVAPRSAYDSRPIVGGDGVLYVFYYEPKSRTARAAISTDGQNFRDMVLDSRESGWQLDAIPSDDGAIAVYSFSQQLLRDLRGVALHNGQPVHPPISIVREDRWNAGWHPHLVSDHGHGVWLTYLSNVEAETRVWSHFDAPSNVFDYAMADTKTWEDDYKNWFVQAGAGVWYTFWNLSSKAASGGDVDGAHLNDAKYHVDPALLISANLEARFGPVDLRLRLRPKLCRPRLQEAARLDRSAQRPIQDQ